MTESEFRSFLMFAAIFAVVIGLANMLRPNRRSLGAGAIFLGIAAFLYTLGFPLLVVGIACGLGVYSLGKDVVTRTGSRA